MGLIEILDADVHSDTILQILLTERALETLESLETLVAHTVTTRD